MLRYQFRYFIDKTVQALASRHTIRLGCYLIDAHVIVGFLAPNFDAKPPEPLAVRRRRIEDINDGLGEYQLEFPVKLDRAAPAKRRDAYDFRRFQTSTPTL